MICYYCQQKTVKKPLSIENEHTINVEFCENCKAEYIYWADGVLTTHLYTYINDKMYRWSVDSDGVIGRLWHYEEPGIPAVRPNRKGKLVKVFHEDKPDITPQNINDKIKLILLFM